VLIYSIINEPHIFQSIINFKPSLCSFLVCLFVCLLSVYLYIQYTSKRLNWLGPIFCGTSSDSRECFWMIEFSKICLWKNSIFWKFWKSTTFFFIKSAKFCLFLYSNVNQEMSIIEIEDESLQGYPEYGKTTF